MGFASRMQRRAATNAVVYLSSADFPARIGMGSCVEDNARYSPIVERVCTRRIHSALLPPMRFVFLSVVISVSSLTALAQEKSTPTAASLPGRAAELRRGDRYSVADFFEQQRFRAGQDRRQNGRILSEGAHFIQARACDAEDRRGRSVDA